MGFFVGSMYASTPICVLLIQNWLMALSFPLACIVRSFAPDRLSGDGSSRGRIGCGLEFRIHRPLPAHPPDLQSVPVFKS
jgi:hypothetical protein